MVAILQPLSFFQMPKPKAGIVGAVSDIENRRHLPCCVSLHLFKEGLQVGALQQHVKLSLLNEWFRTLASQNLTSVIGPGLFPLFSSSAESLPSTSSVWMGNSTEKIKPSQPQFWLGLKSALVFFNQLRVRDLLAAFTEGDC